MKAKTREVKCPSCGALVPVPAGPAVTVDIIIEMDGGDGIVLIQRRHFPLGWAIPGGFVDGGESAEDAARREAKEETSLDVELTEQFHTYSRPDRDPRGQTISTVFLARARGTPRARDDAKGIGVFAPPALPDPIVFDHAEILADYFDYRNTGKKSKKKTIGP